MGNMDGWACPNVAVQPGLECVWRCRCSVEYCQRLMGDGGHIVSAPTKQEGALGPVCICRDFVIWHSVHGADWVEARHRAQHRHSNSVQNTLGDWCGDACVWVGSMVGGLVVAGASWGDGRKCCGLNKILPMPILILLLPNK